MNGHYLTHLHKSIFKHDIFIVTRTAILDNMLDNFMFWNYIYLLLRVISNFTIFPEDPVLISGNGCIFIGQLQTYNLHNGRSSPICDNFLSCHLFYA